MLAAPEVAAASSKPVDTHPCAPASVVKPSPARRTPESPMLSCKEWLVWARSTRTTITCSTASICQTIRRSPAFMRSKLIQLTRAHSFTLVRQVPPEEARGQEHRRSQSRARSGSSSLMMWRWISARAAKRSLGFPRRFQIWSVSPH